MSTAAEFDGKIAHIDYTYDIAIFLAKQSLCSGLLCLLDRHVLHDDRKTVGDLFVYHILDFFQLFRSHCGEMRKVKAQPVLVDAGTRLLHMSAENGAESLLEKVGRTVVSRGKRPFLCVNFKRNFVSHFDHAFCHNTDMSDLSTEQLNGIFYFKFTFRGADIPCVSLLTAARRIKRCLIYKHSALLTFGERVCELVLRGEYCYIRLPCQIVISDKGACHTRVNGFVYCHVSAHVVRHFTRVSRGRPLDFHGSLKSFFIHIHSLFFQDLFCQIQREPISIIETERIIAVQCLLTLCLHVCDHIREDAKALVDSLVKLFFLFCDHFEDELFLFFQLRISVLRAFDHSLSQFRKETFVDTQKPSVTAGAS